MSNDKNAQELLKWGLANSTGVTAAPGPTVEQISADIKAGRRPDLADPNLYNAIMGKSEAQMMQEELAVAIDTSRSVEDRCIALDNFEMLIEQIDNANNITSMKMWQPIISLLSANHEPQIQTAAAWILGTAVQNNDKAQMAVLEFQPVVALTDLLQSENEEVRAKAMYALSGLLKHNPAAMDQFDKLDGWKTLRLALLDPNIGLRRKTAFLINALLFQDPNSFNPNTNDSTSTSTTSAPISSATTSSSTTAFISTARAVAPLPTSSSSSSSSSSQPPAAPLERGPATLQTSIPHPNVSNAIVNSGILKTLISSLLPPNSHHDMVADSDLPPPSGADGDSDPRSDLDFAEKAATAILTFTAKLPNPSSSSSSSSSLPSLQHHSNITSLLKALLTELQSHPLDPSSTSTRWQELDLDESQFLQFKDKVESW